MFEWPSLQSVVTWLLMAAMAFGWLLASVHSRKP